MSTKLDSLVLLVTISVLALPWMTTGHGQLWAKENISSGFDIGHNQQGSLLTRRIRQSSGLSTTTIAANNSNKTNQNQSSLTCYQCRSFEDGDQCIHLPANSTIFNQKCGPQHTACMVKRFSYTENATSPLALWYIERNCSTKCDPGCLILGERTKLYACNSCCKEKLCNIGNGTNHLFFDYRLAAFLVFLLSIFFQTEKSA